MSGPVFDPFSMFLIGVYVLVPVGSFQLLIAALRPDSRGEIFNTWQARRDDREGPSAAERSGGCGLFLINLLGELVWAGGIAMILSFVLKWVL